KTKVIERIAFTEMYRGFLEFADQLGPYQSRLHVFDYDWRQSNTLSTAKLREFLCTIAEEHPQSPLYVVAHSMGGLIVRGWLHRETRVPCKGGAPPDVRGVAFVATPHTGSPKAVLALMRGYSLLFENWPWPFSKLSRFEKQHILGALNRAGLGFA